jgi:4'-phosphopantetheinyl transferase
MTGEPSTLELAKNQWEPLSAPLDAAVGEAQVIRASLDVSPARREQLGGLLAREETERAARFHSPLDEFRFIVRRGLLRELLGACLRMPAQRIAFAYGDYGKPSVANAEPGSPQFNASHSGGLAVFALTPARAVGVDVEGFRDIPDLADLASTVLSPAEQAEWERADERDRSRAFFRYWTLKEAYLKGLGAGLQRRPDEVEVRAPGGVGAGFQVRDAGRMASDWALQSVAGSDCMIGLALNNSQAPLRLWKWNSEQPFPHRCSRAMWTF